MTPRRPWAGLRRWLVGVWEHVPFARRRGGPGLAGIREPRRPRPPFWPPQAMAAEPESESGWLRSSSVMTLTSTRRRWWWWWRRRPHAGPA